VGVGRGCKESTNVLENTRTMETNWLIRQMAWQMPYHLEHHGALPLFSWLSLAPRCALIIALPLLPSASHPRLLSSARIRRFHTRASFRALLASRCRVPLSAAASRPRGSSCC
jgi:hypothetical protein